MRFARIAAAAVALLAAPALVFAQQIVGFTAALTTATYSVGTDSVNGVVSIVVSVDSMEVVLDPGQFIRLTTADRKEVTLSIKD